MSFRAHNSRALWFARTGLMVKFFLGDDLVCSGSAERDILRSETLIHIFNGSSRIPGALHRRLAPAICRTGAFTPGLLWNDRFMDARNPRSI